MFDVNEKVEIQQFFVVQVTSVLQYKGAFEKAVRRRSDYQCDGDWVVYQWHFDTEKAARSAKERLHVLSAGLAVKLCKIVRVWAVSRLGETP